MSQKRNVTGTINDEGQCIDLYLPRKCEYTNKILHSKDRSSVQINIAEVDENGVALKKNRSVVLSGFVRAKGLGDMALEHTLKEKGLYPIKN